MTGTPPFSSLINMLCETNRLGGWRSQKRSSSCQDWHCAGCCANSDLSDSYSHMKLSIRAENNRGIAGGRRREQSSGSCHPDIPSKECVAARQPRVREEMLLGGEGDTTCLLQGGCCESLRKACSPLLASKCIFSLYKCAVLPPKTVYFCGTLKSSSNTTKAS